MKSISILLLSGLCFLSPAASLPAQTSGSRPGVSDQEKLKKELEPIVRDLEALDAKLKQLESRLAVQ